MLCKSFDNSFMSALCRGSICIHPKHSGIGVIFFDLFLYLLCTSSKPCNIGRSAVWTIFWHRKRIAAVMTNQISFCTIFLYAVFLYAVFLWMICQTDVAVRTLYRFTTTSAAYKSCIASPIDKKHNLLFFFQPVKNQIVQPSAENRFITLWQLPAQIYNRYLRNLTGSPFFQFMQNIFPLKRPIISCNRRSCRA